MRKFVIGALLAGALSLVSGMQASAKLAAPAAGSAGAGTGFPAFGYCIFGAAFGPIWATLRLNRELTAAQAYQSMSFCGLGAGMLIFQNQRP